MAQVVETQTVMQAVAVVVLVEQDNGIAQAKKDDTYNVYGVVEDWYQIDYNGSVGYLYGDLASEVLPGNV